MAACDVDCAASCSVPLARSAPPFCLSFGVRLKAAGVSRRGKNRQNAGPAAIFSVRIDDALPEARRVLVSSACLAEVRWTPTQLCRRTRPSPRRDKCGQRPVWHRLQHVRVPGWRDGPTRNAGRAAAAARRGRRPRLRCRDVGDGILAACSPEGRNRARFWEQGQEGPGDHPRSHSNRWALPSAARGASKTPGPRGFRRRGRGRRAPRGWSCRGRRCRCGARTCRGRRRSPGAPGTRRAPGSARGSARGAPR